MYLCMYARWHRAPPGWNAFLDFFFTDRLPTKVATRIHDAVSQHYRPARHVVPCGHFHLNSNPIRSTFCDSRAMAMAMVWYHPDGESQHHRFHCHALFVLASQPAPRSVAVLCSSVGNGILIRSTIGGPDTPIVGYNLALVLTCWRYRGV